MDYSSEQLTAHVCVCVFMRMCVFNLIFTTINHTNVHHKQMQPQQT